MVEGQILYSFRDAMMLLAKLMLLADELSLSPIWQRGHSERQSIAKASQEQVAERGQTYLPLWILWS